MSNRSPQDRDEGSALTLAIVFITVVGLAAALALGYSSTTIKATSRSFVPARDKLYAADTAVKGAVQYVAAHTSEGKFTTAGACSPQHTFGTVQGQEVKVQVCPRTGSFSPILANSDFHLITRATGSEVGVDFTGSGDLTVYGSVLSRTTINVGAAGNGPDSATTLNVNNGVVQALGGCTGRGVINVDGSTISGCTVATDPTSDPAYTLESGWATTVTARSGSYCNSSTKIATLPGNSKWTGSALGDAIGTCNYVVMQSGYQYLEDVDWTIKQRVVAGDIGSRDVKTAAVGSACDSATGGATVVLGGTSTIKLSGGTATLEVCGKSITQSSGTAVKLPFYGLTADVTTTLPVPLTTNSESTGGSGWNDADKARSIDGDLATLSLAKNTTSSALSLPGWNSSPTVASTVTSISATLRGVSSGSATFALTLLNSDGNTACTSSGTAMPTGTSVTSTTEATVSMTCTRTLAGPYTLRFTATAPNTGTSRAVKIDGFTLKWTRTVTVAKGQSGCVVTVGGCAALQSDGNANSIHLQGYVYMPLARLDLQLPKDALFWVTQGVIVRSIKIQVTASTSVSPTVAADGANINPGDVVITVTIGTTTWVTCRATYTVSGSSVTGSTITNCTRPN